MLYLVLFVIYFALVCWTPMRAGEKGYPPILWLLLAMFLPLVSSIVLAFLPSLTSDANPDPMAGRKRCPDCAETVLQAAGKCRYCGHEFTAEPEGPTIPDRRGSL